MKMVQNHFMNLFIPTETDLVVNFLNGPVKMQLMH